MPIYHHGTSSPYPGVQFVWSNKAEFQDATITIGEEVTFRPPCIIYWGVSIGDHSAVSHNCVIRENTRIGTHTNIGNGSMLDGNLTIGNHVSIHTLCFVPPNTTIEDNVFLGPGCTVTNTKRITHGRNFPLVEEGPHIKFGARIGGGTTICPAVTIGREAFIGAGSVVTTDIPDGTLAYGSPARVIKDVPPEEFYSH